MTKTQRKLWIGLLIMALLTPLGTLLPATFQAGETWGEWGTDKLAELIGYVPAGLKRLSGLWTAPFPDYSLGDIQASPAAQVIAYSLSGFLGMLAVGLATYLILRLIIKNGR